MAVNWKWTSARSIAPDIKLRFTWEGGAYIDVERIGDAYAKEVINVWDYEAGKPSIPVTKAAMRRAIDAWIEEYPKEELVHDVKENWPYM